MDCSSGLRSVGGWAGVVISGRVLVEGWDAILGEGMVEREDERAEWEKIESSERGREGGVWKSNFNFSKSRLANFYRWNSDLRHTL